MKLIVSALKGEIAALFEKYPVRKKEKLAAGAIYWTDTITLLRTGMGIQNARRTVTSFFENYRPEFVLNIGTAGRLNERLKLGGVYAISRLRCENSDDVIALRIDEHLARLPQAVLLTADRAVTNDRLRKALHEKYGADLVDMEAYVIAGEAMRRNISFVSIKIVSDAANARTAIDFMKNYRRYAEKLAAVVCESGVGEAD